MRRRFFTIAALVLLPLAFTGVAATASPASNVSTIDVVDDPIEVKRCEGQDSILDFSFTSTGTGSVTIKAVTPLGAVVGSTEMPVTEPRTYVGLAIHDGYTGYATITIEAANYRVPNGKKGEQGAYTEHPVASIGIVNCALGAPEPSALTASEPPAVTQEASTAAQRPLVRAVAIVAAIMLLGAGVAFICWRLRD